MNTPNPPEELPTGKPAAQQQLEQHEVPEVLEFLKENGVAIVIGVVIAVAGFVGYSAWKSSKKASIDTASNMLASSQTAPQFQEIINNYGDTPASPLAYLSLAGAYFDQGQFEMARQTYLQFVANFPDHDMKPLADLGTAQSLEAVGNLPEALSAYQQFLVQYANHYMMPGATFGKARVLEAMQKFDEARATYEDFIAANPDSRWVTRAEAGVEFVKKQQRALASSVQP